MIIFHLFIQKIKKHISFRISPKKIPCGLDWMNFFETGVQEFVPLVRTLQYYTLWHSRILTGEVRMRPTKLSFISHWDNLIFQYTCTRFFIRMLSHFYPGSIFLEVFWENEYLGMYQPNLRLGLLLVYLDIIRVKMFILID